MRYIITLIVLCHIFLYSSITHAIGSGEDTIIKIEPSKNDDFKTFCTVLIYHIKKKEENTKIENSYLGSIVFLGFLKNSNIQGNIDKPDLVTDIKRGLEGCYFLAQKNQNSINIKTILHDFENLKVMYPAHWEAFKAYLTDIEARKFIELIENT